VAELAPSGEVRLAADSVQDDAMTSCVRDVLSRPALPREAGERASVPIHFELLPPATEPGSAK
jgi:hypothetical protein